MCNPGYADGHYMCEIASRHYGVKSGVSAYYICRKKVTMENTSKVQSRRGRGLKFDQEWKDAVDRLPKHYRDEICAAIEAYQRDLTVIEVSEGVPRAIFMLIMPTIRRRYRARELRRLARDRKAASQSRRQEAEQRPSIVRNISAQPSPAMQPKPAVQSDPVMVVKQPESASPAPATVPSGRQPAPVAEPAPAAVNVPAAGQPGKSTLEKLIAHRSRRRNRHRRRH